MAFISSDLFNRRLLKIFAAKQRSRTLSQIGMNKLYILGLLQCQAYTYQTGFRQTLFNVMKERLESGPWSVLEYYCRRGWFGKSVEEDIWRWLLYNSFTIGSAYRLTNCNIL